MSVLSLIAVMLCVVSSTRVFGYDILDTIGDTVNGINEFGCLAAVTTSSGKCVAQFYKQFENRKKEDTDEKVWCCAVRSVRDCVNTISKQECNKDSEKVADMATASLLRGITSDDCANYGVIMCSTVIQIAIIAAAGFAVLMLLTCCCCCCCCCGGKRRANHSAIIVQSDPNAYKMFHN